MKTVYQEHIYKKCGGEDLKIFSCIPHIANNTGTAIVWIHGGGLFEECVQYINAHFKPTKVINVRFKRFDYIFDKNVMSVAMDRDNETFSITIGEYHE